MQENEYSLDIQTMNGKVSKEACGCCLNISFKNILWSIHRETFYSLYSYIKNLLEGNIATNNVDSKCVLLGMEGISMMAWVTLKELKELSQLLELTSIELKREEFERNYNISGISENGRQE